LFADMNPKLEPLYNGCLQNRAHWDDLDKETKEQAKPKEQKLEEKKPIEKEPKKDNEPKKENETKNEKETQKETIVNDVNKANVNKTMLTTNGTIEQPSRTKKPELDKQESSHLPPSSPYKQHNKQKGKQKSGFCNIT
ncbi:hypothetical protein LOTGIDRAFT_167079, partial [Lottia gigantea]